MAHPDPDVLIVGAGPVGCALALALRGSRLRIAVVARPERNSNSSGRPIVLSYASRLILERTGAWQQLAPTPIETIRVSQSQGFGGTRLEAADAGVPALGYVVDYGSLVASFLSAVRNETKIQVLEQAEDLPSPSLTVHAEGASPESEQRAYDQHALVALVTTEPPAGSTAFERFTPEGPLALLPLAGRYAVVWSTRPERAAEMMKLPDTAFLAALEAACGGALGRLLAVEGRATQPLALRVRAARTGDRAAYIGNAAQTLHPVAGQGLNLGLRDAWDLAEVLRDAPDPGDAAVLRRFARLRRLDAATTIRVTDGLARAFLGNGRLASAARAIAMTTIDIVPPARRFFARRMIFGPSALP